MKWHKLSKKLAKINTIVFILNNEHTIIHKAVLKIYDKEISNLASHNFTDGDIYWDHTNSKTKASHWATIKDFPYWLTTQELLKLTTNKTLINTNKTDRFEILDL